MLHLKKNRLNYIIGFTLLSTYIGFEYNFQLSQQRIINSYNLVSHVDYTPSMGELKEYLPHFSKSMLDVNWNDLESLYLKEDIKDIEGKKDQIIYEFLIDVFGLTRNTTPYISNNSDEYFYLENKIWELTKDICQKYEIESRLEKPVNSNLDKYIYTYERPIKLSVCKQSVLFNKLSNVFLKSCSLVIPYKYSFKYKKIQINGMDLHFWTNGVKSEKATIFFHGAGLGGPIFYMKAISKLIPQDQKIICYEIPNVRLNHYVQNFPTTDMISRAILEMIDNTTSISIIGHSLGCDYVVSLVQYWKTNDLRNKNYKIITKDKILLIEPFNLINKSSLENRKVAFKCPEKFPLKMWNLVLGNLNVQLALKRSMYSGYLLWLNPTNSGWNNWKKKGIVLENHDPCINFNDSCNAVMNMEKTQFSLYCIKGGHGSWIYKNKKLDMLTRHLNVFFWN